MILVVLSEMQWFSCLSTLFEVARGFRDQKYCISGYFITLEKLYIRCGSSTEILSDEDPQIAAAKVANFCLDRGINIFEAPEDIRTPKDMGNVTSTRSTKAIKKGEKDRITLGGALKTFLGRYRSTPHSNTKKPANYFFSKNVGVARPHEAITGR